MRRPMVCTVLEPPERARVEAAGMGCYAVVHRESVPGAIRAVRERAVDAVVLSVHRCNPAAVCDVGALVREFPSVPTVAVLSYHDARSSGTLLKLGASGVRTVVDLTAPRGWHQLRELVSHPTSPAVARILGVLLPALEGCSVDLIMFFEVATRLAPRVGTVRHLCAHLDVMPSTLMSRFFRAGVPSPRCFLAWIQELPGCKVEGQTKPEAFKNLGELFEDYINTRLEWKDNIQEPARPEKPTAYQTEHRQRQPKVVSLRFVEPSTLPDSSLDQLKQTPKEVVTAGI